jgi:hypothetical protein
MAKKERVKMIAVSLIMGNVLVSMKILNKTNVSSINKIYVSMR